MLTRIATATLAISLLAASALVLPVLERAKSFAAGAEQTSGVTVVEKNSPWPLKSRMSMDPCAVTICQEA
jgi:hypothetical protein